MSLVPTKVRDYSTELDAPQFFPPYDFHLYPYLRGDPRLWWPNYQLLRPMDELVTRRVRNQLIQSHLLDWAFPLTWDNYYNGERVRIDEKGFRVDIDVSEFEPHEIVVKTNDYYVIVEGKHAKRNDGNGMVQRQFYRKYLLPRGFNPDHVISDLSVERILTIKAPPPPPERYYKSPERLVKVHETGRFVPPWKK